MKKIFVVAFLILAILLAGVAAALSILPHTHGKDLDHHKHSSCAVYQIGLVGFVAVKPAAIVFKPLQITFFLALLHFLVISDHKSIHSFSRSPPSLLGLF